MKLLSCVRLFGTPWTVARQAPLSMGILQAGILEWVAIPFSRIHRHSDHHQHCLLGLRQKPIRLIPNYRVRYIEEKSCGMNVGVGVGRKKKKPKKDLC